MRHRLGLRKLNRTGSHRLAMLRNMTVSLLRHEVIKTTLPKAKELRRVAEPILTLGKSPSLANRRLAFDRLRDREMVTKLFGELGPRYAKRNGGYLIRIAGPSAECFAGREVPVNTKDGTEHVEKLERMIWTGLDKESGSVVALYKFVSKPREAAPEVEF